MFDHSDTVQEIAFRYAVDRVNADRDIMPRSRLTAQIERIREQDSFYASKQGKPFAIITLNPFINKDNVRIIIYVYQGKMCKADNL